ncbi:MAG: radical SAM protein [Thermodesulfobacteriota bacterium]|nr:radical SAM protein [Thermodesulfobacteriota bacterium]
MDLRFTPCPSSVPFVQAVVANRAGEIYELDEYAALGMAAGNLAPLATVETVPMSHGSELMRLPQRRPVVYNLRKHRVETLSEDPYSPGEPIYPVAVFNSPGYMITRISAYEEQPDADYLPLFSYGAVGWYGEGFQSAAIQVDTEPRQDLRRMPREKILVGVRQMRRKMPKNRLRRHLENCALVYGCPAAKNFFLGRYEAPLPTSQSCNARCRGCISLQENTGIQSSQDRIKFTPTPEEAEVALAHIAKIDRPVVSFGQGCEGEPLLAADVIEPAIRLIRKKTSAGTINMNTNASRPDILNRLFEAGLDSIRVSLNSVRPDGYSAYFRPRSYRFTDVIRSIDLAVLRNRFVAINYLNSPGFTDTPEELDALMTFIRQHAIHMIQWRNLNFDPLRYWQIINRIVPSGQPLGMERMFKTIAKRFPNLMHGYFNPPREKWP